MDEKKKPIWKRWWFWGIVLVFIVIASSGGGDDNTVPTSSKPSVPAVPAVNDSAVQQTPVELEAPAEEINTETLSQKNAVAKAKSYLDYTAFSKSGLIEQMEYEGFSNADATYAVNKITVNWKEQAVLKGKSYLDYTSFSGSGLIEQLEYDGFSHEEATYAVDTIGL